ncbi:MAG: hypothetical protein ACR2JB_05655 [Bryobacteraceae bacterium]
MANGSLERRLSKLEKAGGGVSTFDERLRKFCAHGHVRYTDEMREALRGHEAEIHISEDGLMTYENFRIVCRCLGVKGA